MTNETGPHRDGGAETVIDEAAIAATSTADAAGATGEPAGAAEATPPGEGIAVGEPAPTAPKLPSFEDLGLHPDVRLALDDMGYFQPTPVQTAVYKPVSEGKDLLVQSRTGTGKTAAFGLPTINNLIPTHHAPQALILTPTRELALQVARELTQIGKHRGVRVEPIYGGAPIGKQIKALKDGVHVVVGTPGRVLDHIGRRTLDCRTVQTFILDECDEMLSMGFLEDIERVVSHLPEKKQTLLFSATMPDEVQRYSRRHMRAPEQISLSRDSISVAEIHHAYYIVSGIARSRDLLKIIFAEEPESAIIFCNMRDETTMVAKFLQKQGLDAEPLSSDLAQADRERVMGRMKQKNLRFLVATDVAARGIDITDLSHVINYSVPESPEAYVHRTGRTGRAGKRGTALSMVGPRELGNFRYVRLQFGIKPEERVLPKDDIFVGKLKVPLPPVGTPQPPDPIQILIRGVPGTPTDLERQIFEKLLVSTNGRRVLAKLVADKLDKLTTRARPKRAEREDRGEREERGEDRGDRGERGERGDRPRFDGDRPRFDGDRPRFDGDRPRPDGDRPRFDGDRPRPDGDRPRFDGDRPRPDGDRPRFDGDRPRFDGDRGERPRRDTMDGDRPRVDGDRDRPRRFDRDERGERGERSDRPRVDGERGERDRDRPRRFDRDDRRDRRFDRDDRRDRGDRPRVEGERGERGDREERGERGRERSDTQQITQTRIEGPPADQAAFAPGLEVQPEVVDLASAPAIVEAQPERAEPAERAERPERADRDRDRDRDREPRRRDRDRDRGRDRDRDRDRGRPEAPVRAEPAAEPRAASEDRFDNVAVVGTEAAPAVEAPAPARTEAPAPTASGRADRDKGERKGRRDKREVTEETREFWETWAEEKSTREPAPAPAREPAREATREPAPAAAAETAESSERGDGGERRARDKDRDRGDRGERGARDKDRARGERGARDKDRGSRDKDRSRDKPEASEAPAEREPRGKGDTAGSATTAAEGAQARLFISLGKKHGVTADDLRALLAGPLGGDKERIGSVSLRDSHAHVRVPEELVEKIIAGVHGTQHNEHEVTVERARA